MVSEVTVISIEFHRFRGGNSRDLREISPELQYNDKPFDYSWRYARTKLTNDLHLQEDQGELNALFDGLVPAGYIPRSIWRLNPPDFRVLLQSNKAVHVEVVAAGSEEVIKQENTIPDLHRVIFEWSQTPEAQEKLRGFSVGFVPDQIPSAKQEAVIVEEIKRYILSESLTETPFSRIEDQTYPVMTACDTHVSINPNNSALAIVSTPTGTFGNGEGIGAIARAVNKKTKKDYSAFAPIWLVVSMDHVIVPSIDSAFDWIERKMQSVGQFEKVFFCNSNQVLIAE